MEDQVRDAGRSEAGASTEAKGKEPGKRLGPKPKHLLLLIVVVVAALLLLLLVQYQTRGKFYQETNDATIQADSATISARTAGYVTEILVAENQDVQAGQPLLRIDSRDYQAKAAQAEAKIAQAGAGIEAAHASVSEQLATIEQSRAQLASARAKAAHDRAEVARYTPLVVAGAENRAQLSQLKSTADQSDASVRAQVAALAVQERHIRSIQAQIRQNQAEAQGARAQLFAANVDVGATLVRAPFAGRIGDKTVTLGQLAQPGARLMSVVPLDKLYILANFKETQLALMRPGQPVIIKVDALGVTKLKGRVASLSPGTGAQFSVLPSQNATGNFTKIVQRVPIRIALEATPEARRLLVPGMSVVVTVDTISANGDLDRIQEAQERQSERG